jgi:hypothetical protein
MVRIEQCPQAELGDMIPVIKLALRYNKFGQGPILAGVLDQAAWFVEFADRLEVEETRIEQERARGN